MVWRSQPIFISSTFDDMQAERDYLRSHVFPELESQLRAQRTHLEWVDLRVGVPAASVTDANARELQVLKVCLGEVQRCRPFFIFLLGDRYGWVPPVDAVRTAVSEQGVSGDPTGQSVTELEIELGVFAISEREARCFFYFREPLAYDLIPQEIAVAFCDARASDPGAQHRQQRLVALKKKIAARLPGRVRHYRAEWDPKYERVTGLEKWGQQVLKDVLSETKSLAPTAAALTWQEQERASLDEFVEDRARDFIGRSALLTDLMQFTNAAATDEGWGAVVTGEPGSGKSAVFSQMLRRLREDGALVLAHATGAGPRAASVDSMLRRWIEELSVELGTATDLPAHADTETVEAMFSSRLAQAARSCRVVVLVDALDQFEQTVRGRYATWLPRSWPANAKLVATSQKGDAANALAERRAVKAVPMPAFDAGEARELTEAICARYHRRWEPEVLNALLMKRDGQGFSWRNPLWLTLAVEELNLLDAGDFARARREYVGPPAERLRDLMLDRVVELPNEIESLFRAIFERVENLFGRKPTQTFLGLIGVSRSGWRDSDFKRLLPVLTGQPWEELTFALMRRYFRSQLHRRNELGQWDFRHLQARMAVLSRVPTQEVTQVALHEKLAEHLLSLPRDDPLRESECMVHLLGGRNMLLAQSHYGDKDLTESEERHATQVLADTLITGNGIESLVRLFGSTVPNLEVRIKAARRVLYRVCDSLRERGATAIQDALLQWIAGEIERLTQSYKQPDLQVDVAASLDRVGDVKLMQGKIAEAEVVFDKAHTISSQLSSNFPKRVDWQRDLAVSFNKIGDRKLARADYEGAAAHFRSGLSIMKGVAALEPDNSEWRRDLGVSHRKLAEVCAKAGNLNEAEAEFRKAVMIHQALATSNPYDVTSQSDLATCNDGLGDVRLTMDDLPTAEAFFRSSLAIRERLAGQNPGAATWRHAAGLSYLRLALAQGRGGNLTESTKSQAAALALLGRAAEEDPDNTQRRRDAEAAEFQLAQLKISLGDLEGAEKLCRKHLNAAELRDSHAGKVANNSEIASSYSLLADVMTARGDRVGAIAAYESAVQRYERDMVSFPANRIIRWMLAKCHLGLGEARSAQQDMSAAARSFAASVSLLERLTAEGPSDVNCYQDLGRCYSGLRKVHAALGDLKSAEECYRSLRRIQTAIDGMKTKGRT